MMLRLRQARHSGCFLDPLLVFAAVELLAGLVMELVGLGRGGLRLHHEVLVAPGALLAVLVLE